MSPRHVVVDGSNIATEGRSLPSLAQLDQAVREFLAENPDDVVTVVVDASFAHRIEASEVASFEAAEEAGEVVSPPAGAIGRGDAFLLRIAEKTGATVLSNDSFQEFHGEHEWVFDRGRLIGGKPVPGVGWIFTPRTPVRGPKSREAVKEAKRRQRTEEVGVPAAPMVSTAKGRGPKVSKAIATATDEVNAPGDAPRRRRRRTSEPPAEPVNGPLTFITFIAEHPLGSEVKGTVDTFSSHGAFVNVGDVRCYVPLSAMGEPPPRRAREVISKGEERSFVIQALDPLRRGVELALPGFARVAGVPTDETVEAEIRPLPADDETEEPTPVFASAVSTSGSEPDEAVSPAGDPVAVGAGPTSAAKGAGRARRSSRAGASGQGAGRDGVDTASPADTPGADVAQGKRAGAATAPKATAPKATATKSTGRKSARTAKSAAAPDDAVTPAKRAARPAGARKAGAGAAAVAPSKTAPATAAAKARKAAPGNGVAQGSGQAKAAGTRKAGGTGKAGVTKKAAGTKDVAAGAETVGSAKKAASVEPVGAAKKAAGRAEKVPAKKAPAVKKARPAKAAQKKAAAATPTPTPTGSRPTKASRKSAPAGAPEVPAGTGAAPGESPRGQPSAPRARRSRKAAAPGAEPTGGIAGRGEGTARQRAAAARLEGAGRSTGRARG